MGQATTFLDQRYSGLDLRHQNYHNCQKMLKIKKVFQAKKGLHASRTETAFLSAGASKRKPGFAPDLIPGMDHAFSAWLPSNFGRRVHRVQLHVL